MTIKDQLTRMCEEHGLWPDEARKVLEQTIKNTPAMEERRWNEDVSTYPASMLAVLWMGTRHEAVKWIDENKPQHFARMMFIY